MSGLALNVASARYEVTTFFLVWLLSIDIDLVLALLKALSISTQIATTISLNFSV